MRRKIWITVMMTALVLGLAGCGAREQQKDTAEKKNKADAVIQDAGTTSEEQQKVFLKAHTDAVLTKHCLYTDYNDDDCKDVIVQMDYEGNELKRFPINEEEIDEELLCGSDKRLILSRNADVDEDDETRVLYSVPIVQTEDGETVQWEQEEKITSYYDEFLKFPNAVLCDPYLLYKEDRNTLVRLDMETGERKNFTFPLTDLRLYHFGYIDDDLYLVTKNDDDMDSGKNSAVYRLNIAEGTSEKLYECEKQDEYPYDLFVDGQFIYMLFTETLRSGVLEDWIECFDLEQQKTVGQLSFEEIKRLIQDEVMAGSVEEVWEFALDGLSLYGGRLYIMARTSWLTEKGGDGEAAIPRTVLLSCSAKDMTDLKYEQDLAEWFQEQGCDKFVSGIGTGGYKDIYYFIYEDENHITHMMRYYLDTKQIEEVDKKELIRQVYCNFD